MCRKKEGACHKCQRISFNITLTVCFCFYIVIPGVHSYANSWNFVMEPEFWTLLMGFCDFLIAAFAILYFIASIIILFRYYQKRRLCRVDNCSFYIFSLGFFVLSLLGLKYTQKSLDEHQDDFNVSCAQLALGKNISPDSFFREVHQVYKNAAGLLCSAECPCGLRLNPNDGNLGAGLR